MKVTSQSDNPDSIGNNALIDELLSWKRENWQSAQIASWNALIPGMAHLQGGTLKEFYKLIEQQRLQNVQVRKGSLVINKAARPYHFICRELNDETLVIVAVHLEVKGQDLFANWIEFGFKITHFNIWARIGFIFAGLICYYPFFIFIITLWWGYLLFDWATTGRRISKGSSAFKGVQVDEAGAFKETVWNSLVSAFGNIGIPTEMIREISSGLYDEIIRATKEYQPIQPLEAEGGAQADRHLVVPDNPKGNISSADEDILGLPIEPAQAPYVEPLPENRVSTAHEPELIQRQREALYFFRQATAKRIQIEEGARRDHVARKEAAETTKQEGIQKADQLLEEARQAYEEGRGLLDKANLSYLLPDMQSLTLPATNNRPEQELMQSAVETKEALSHVQSGVKALQNWKTKRRVQRVSLLIGTLLFLALIMILSFPYFQIATSGGTIIKGGYWQNWRWQWGSVAFSADGEILASVAQDGTVRVIQASDGNLLHAWRVSLSGSVTSIALAPDGETLALGLADATVRLLRVSDGMSLRSFILEGYVDGLAFAPDGKTLAASVYLDDSVQLWRVADGVLLLTIETAGSNRIAFAPNGATLASVGWDNPVQLWRVADGVLLLTFELVGSDTIAFAPNGETLASVNWNNSVQLWRVADGALLRTLQTLPLSFDIYSIAFSADEKHFNLATEYGDWPYIDNNWLITLPIED